MKAWKIDRLGGKLSYIDIPIPEVRLGSVLIRVQSQSLMSYLKPYVEGKLAAYRAPEVRSRRKRHRIVEAVNLRVIIYAPKRDVNVTSAVKSHQIYQAFPTVLRFHPCGHLSK